MNISGQRWRSAATMVLVAALALAACTKSVSSGTVPTVTVGAGSQAGGPTTAPLAQDPTMAALGTAIRMTQTAQALAGVGGGGEVTPGGPATTAAPAGGTTPVPAATTAVPTVVTPVATTPVPVAGTCPNPYTVKQGDWIYKIARDCKVDPKAIIAANPGIDPNLLHAGQKLNMPTAATVATQAACKGTHTVVKGENLFRIAYNCGLTTEQLAAFNGIAYPYTIYPGQIIKFP